MGKWDLITKLSQVWENRNSWRVQINLVCTRIQGKRAMIPQENELDLPVCAWESLVEAWLIVACHGVRGTGQQSWEAQCAGISPLGGGCHYPYKESITLL